MKVNVLREVRQPWHSRTSQTRREFLSIAHLVIYLFGNIPQNNFKRYYDLRYQ